MKTEMCDHMLQNPLHNTTSRVGGGGALELPPWTSNKQLKDTV